jgi:hypothetical protein
VVADVPITAPTQAEVEALIARLLHPQGQPSPLAHECAAMLRRQCAPTVPREPTPEMITAGTHAPWHKEDARSEIVKLVWRAMYKTAPQQPPAPITVPPEYAQVTRVSEATGRNIYSMGYEAGRRDERAKNAQQPPAPPDEQGREI